MVPIRSPIPGSIIHSSHLSREGLLDVLRSEDCHVGGRWIRQRAGCLGQPRGDGEIVLYDLATQRRDGPSMIVALRGQHAEIKVLVFDVIDNDQGIIKYISAGASGCIPHETSAEDLPAAIRSLALRTPPPSPRVITTLFSYGSVCRLAMTAHRNLTSPPRRTDPSIDRRGLDQQEDCAENLPSTANCEELRLFGPPETEPAHPPGADPLVAVGQALRSVPSRHLQVLRY